MLDSRLKILLIEDNPGDARLIKEMIADGGGQGFTIEWVSRLAEGLERLGQGGIDLVLLDLDLPDSRGLDTFLKAHAQAPHVPFVVLTGLADENLALNAVVHGAQDYLFKNETYAHLLLRAIRYATERKKAETALEAERQKLYSLLNSLPAFVHLTAADQHIRFANRRFIEIFGEPEDKPCYAILRKRTEPCEDCRAPAVLKDGVPREFEWTSPLDSHTYEVYNYPFCTDNDRLLLTLGIDITKRKQAEEAIKDREEQLTAIYEHAPLIMMLVDGDRRVRKVNRLAEQFAGASATEMIGRRGGEALRCLHALDDPEGCGFGPHCQECPVRRTVVETFETGQSHRQVEACLPFAPEGKLQDVTFLLCTARLVVRGQPQVLITIQDISLRKQADEKLRESEHNLRSLASQLLTSQERERQRIAHGLHDELGQSLLVLKLQASHIKKSLDKEQLDLRKECRDMIHQLDRLVDEVRRLARDLSPTMVRDLGLASALKRLIEKFSQHYDLQTDIHLMEGLDELFPRETQTSIYRIFQESLTNIGKYAQASRLTIAIEREADQVGFMVADNGRGCSLDEVMGRDPTNRGLGLIAMRERVRMMGGSLEITSEEGKGTRIAFRIPVGRSQPVTDP
jgi:signal transduction histidine kinase/CheY-like chemotaxis protein